MAGVDACFRCGKPGNHAKKCRGKSPIVKASEAMSKKEINPYPTCGKCGKMHIGECLLGKDGCYVCGELGHKIRDCPVAIRRGRERARNVLSGKYVLLWLG